MAAAQPPPAPGKRRRQSASQTATDTDLTTGQPAGAPQAHGAAELARDLNYTEARTALELSLAELQASDLDVEAMAGLYLRAEAYAQRCEELLNQVEQEVVLWNSSEPTAPPTPFKP